MEFPRIQASILLASGNSLDLAMVPQSRVAELKVSIMNQLHVPLVCQNLLLGTTVLNDDDMLGDHTRAFGVPLLVKLVVSHGVDRNQKLIITQALARDFLAGNQKAIAVVSMHLSDCDDAVSGSAAEVFTQSLLKCESGIAMAAMSTARTYLADCEMTRAAVLPVRIMLSLASAKARLIDCDDRHLPIPFRLRLASVSHGAGAPGGEEADWQVALKGLLEIPSEALLHALQEVLRNLSVGTFRQASFGLICFAVAGRSGSMDGGSEKAFLVQVVKDVLEIAERVQATQNKGNRVLVVSWLYYILVRYPNFLSRHYKFLERTISKLHEFMHDCCPIVNEMAVNYFLQICQCCGDKLAVLQMGKNEPLIQELVRNLRQDASHLADDLLKMYVEALTLVMNKAEDKELLLMLGRAQSRQCRRDRRNGRSRRSHPGHRNYRNRRSRQSSGSHRCRRFFVRQSCQSDTECVSRALTFMCSFGKRA